MRVRDQPRFGPLRLAHILPPRVVHRHRRLLARLTEEGSQGCVLPDGPLGRRLPVGLQDDVSAWNAARVEPHILGCCCLERQRVVFAVRTPHKNESPALNGESAWLGLRRGPSESSCWAAKIAFIS